MEQNILDSSKIRKLLFLGPKGSYSDFAKNKFIEYFNLNCVTTNIKSISSVIKALKDENSEDMAAVIPIENSIEGIVRETLDNLSSLKRENIKILAETALNVEHALIGYGTKKNIKNTATPTSNEMINAIEYVFKFFLTFSIILPIFLF